jgi:hypothetical protein
MAFTLNTEAAYSSETLVKSTGLYGVTFQKNVISSEKIITL